MMKTKMIEMAVITGAKSHDVIGFHKLFKNLDGITSYIQHIDDFASSPESVRDGYDAVLFFFMMRENPVDEGLPEYRGKPRSALEHLGQTGQGLIMLHHALLAYPQWTVWDEVVGMTNRTLSKYQHDEPFKMIVVDENHSVTQGLSDWAILDETYLMANAAGDNHILLRTDHAQSMETVAWVRQYKASRVFCLQPGHDHQGWDDENFRRVLKQGIEWSCGHR